MISWLKAWGLRWWRVLSRPSAYYSLGFLVVGGFIAGIVFWGGFNTAMEMTNREPFCVGCHEMKDNVFADQYQRWREMNCSPRIARRNTARSLAAARWGMWKSGSVYDPKQVGAASPAEELTGVRRSR